MLNLLQSRPVGPSFVPDRLCVSSLVWPCFISRSMVLLPRLKSLPLPGSVILSSHLPFPVCKRYACFASALHRYGVCFASNEIDSFANELSTRQIEKSHRVKHEKFNFFRKTKRYAIKKIFGTRTQGF